jgi:hypothetical protein
VHLGHQDALQAEAGAHDDVEVLVVGGQAQQRAGKHDAGVLVPAGRRARRMVMAG